MARNKYSLLRNFLLIPFCLSVVAFFLWYFFWPSTGELPPNPTEIKTVDDLHEMERRARAGDVDATLEVGLYYLIEDGRTNLEEAIHYLKPLAEKGNDRAQYYLGCAYNSIDDTSKAIYWWKKSAVQGNKSAEEKILDPNSKEYKQLIQEDEEARLREIREYEERKMRSTNSRP